MLKPVLYFTPLTPTPPMQRSVYTTVNSGSEIQVNIDLVATPGDVWEWDSVECGSLNAGDSIEVRYTDDDGNGVVACVDPFKLTLEYGNAEAWAPPGPVLVGIEEV